MNNCSVVKIKQKRFRLSYLFLFFCFFPFIGFNIGTDTQPFALILAITILCISNRFSIKDKYYLIPFVIILGILSLISIFYLDLFFVLKRLFSYASILIIPIAAYNSNIFDNQKKFEKYIKVFILIWFVVGFLQTYINSSFLTFLVALSRTSVTRGVCSLASEPSFYGYMCFLMFLFALDFKENRYLFSVLIFIQVILFAQSTVSLLYFLIFLILYMAFSIEKNIIKKFIYIIVGIVLIVIVVNFILTQLSGTRLASLISSFINNPIELFENDESAASRLDAIVFSFSRYGLPYLIGERVLMSGFGSVFYEMGIFSLLLYFPILKTIYYSNYKIRYVLVISILICMFSAIQLSSPLFGLYIGYCYYKIEKKGESL